MEIELGYREPFNLDHTMMCGQVFGWRKEGDWWYGVINNVAMKIKQEEDKLKIHASQGNNVADVLERYLGLKDDLDTILRVICRDRVVVKAAERFKGLRIIRQGPWQCLISYMCTANSNIPNIEKMIFNMSARFGRWIEFERRDLYNFPGVETLSRVRVEDLSSCGLGFRAKHVLLTVKRIASGKFSLEELRKLDYFGAREAFLSESQEGKILPGVGPKIADCVLLFAYGMQESFPTDVWITKVIAKFYRHLFEGEFAKKLGAKLVKPSSLSPKEYEVMTARMREYFKPYAGYAQQYLYYFARSGGLKEEL